MTSTFRRIPRPALLGAACATAMTAAVLLAPHAGADDEQRVAAEGTEHRAGCSYQLTAVNVVGYSSGDSGATVTFFDDGQVIAAVRVPTIGSTTTTWHPASAGEHLLTAKVDSITTRWITPATVTVEPSTGSGSAACGLPSFSG
ncbi:hypothetical protein [Nocardia sp. SSK8]|uniref:hypothetical protein n=1 Tax=Nocardia sp. SSK8 TaxID=3120154 RepID=UPI0030080A77